MTRSGIFLSLALVGLARSFAIGAESLVVVLRDGNKKRTVTPLSFDENGLTARYGSRRGRFSTWDKLTPRKRVRRRATR